MAPADAAKALQSNRTRPSFIRPIVPAIPLPYMQKRKPQAAVSKKVEEERISPPLDHAPSNASQAATDVSPPLTNGTFEATIDVEAGVKLAPAIISIAATKTEVGAPLEELQETSTQASLADDLQNSPPAAVSEQHSSESRSIYSMPPAFVPASHGHSNSTTHEAVKFPRQPYFNSQNPMHNAHPSAGSLVFGGYPESNNSSPAPPPSAGGSQQQHLIQYEGGRVQAPSHNNGGHIHNFSNGHSHMAPPPVAYNHRQDGFMNHNAGPDNFSRRQIVSFGPSEGYSPSGTPITVENQRFPVYDPSTPHSFHGSQSSIPNEQELNAHQFHLQYSAAVVSNGSNGHVDDVRLYHQTRHKSRAASQTIPMGQNNHGQPNLAQTQMLPAMDNLDGLVEYLQSQFAEPQFADYTLELRYSDDRATPVRIPGHNLLFARSPTLKNLMTAQAESNGDGLTPRTLFIETGDRFLRSDGFWMAVQRLYGGPLLDPGASASSTIPAISQLSSRTPGTPADRFEVALGYAAAGNILHMPPVVNRGIDIASHFVSWLTLEKALDFALDGGLDSQWTLGEMRFASSPSTYGPAVNMLIHSSMNFIITNFPPNFELDISVSEPSYNRRLPFIKETYSTLPNPRLSSIKFGDHLSEELSKPNVNHSIPATLSKILINLPFPLLKYVLESSHLGNVHGWATTALRQKVMHSVVEEREKRRTQTYDNRSVSNTEREADAKRWEAVGWQESVTSPYGGAENPSLSRDWVNFILTERH